VADKQDTSQDFNPKHRVVGAIILVVLAVILVPWILRDRAPSTPPQPTADAPAPDTRLVVTPLTPVPLTDKPPAPVTVKTIPSLVAPATPAASETGAVTASISDAPLPGKPAVKSPSKPSPATALGKGWIVQVGAFSHTDNAKRLKESLVRHGYAPELDKIALNPGQGVRVRVGPYATEADARAAQARIQRELGIKGVVRAYP
jgi:DedD protein